jgi:hypothetical protein
MPQEFVMNTTKTCEVASCVFSSSRVYTNVALTAIALLLGMMVLNTGFRTTTADAQVGVVGEKPMGEDSSGLISAGEQRKAIIAELRSVSERLDRIEGVLNKGINVKVTSMPAMSAPAPAAPVSPAK